MKLKFIIIGLTFLSGTAVSLRSLFNDPVDEYNALLFENIEALAQEEVGVEGIDCRGNGSIDCPNKEGTGKRIRYFSLRDKVSLY